MIKRIGFTREMTDAQYKAFKKASKLEEQSADEFITTWSNSAIEGSLHRYPDSRNAPPPDLNGKGREGKGYVWGDNSANRHHR